MPEAIIRMDDNNVKKLDMDITAAELDATIATGAADAPATETMAEAPPVDMVEHCSNEPLTKENVYSAGRLEAIARMTNEIELENALRALIDYADKNGVKGKVEIRRAVYRMHKVYMEEASKKEFLTASVSEALINYPGAPKELTKCRIPHGWTVSDRGVYYPEITPYKQPIYVSESYVGYETSMTQYKIRYLDRGGWRSEVVRGSEINSSRAILKLADVGVRVNETNAQTLVKFLADFIEENKDITPTIDTLDRFGWVDTDKADQFVPYGDFGPENDTIGDKFGDIKNHRGNFDFWKEYVMGLMAESEPARMALAASFSSPLVGLLDKQPYFLHFWGLPNVAKSRAQDVGASIYGRPKTYMGTFSGTLVGTERTSLVLCHMPVILEELQSLKAKEDIGTIIHQCVLGKTRARGTKVEHGLEKMSFWRPAYITSGEQSLAEACINQAGAIDRIIDVHVEKPTFANPTEVFDTMNENYGWAGEVYIKGLIDYVAKYGKKRLADLFDKYLDSIMNIKAATGKQVSAAACMCLGEHMARVLVWGETEEEAEYHTLDMIFVLASYCKTANDTNNPDGLFNSICAEVLSNANKFHGAVDDVELNRNAIWGKMKEDLDGEHYYIMTPILDDIIKNRLKLGVSQVVEKLANGGFLKPTVDHRGKTVYYKVVRIDGNKSARCYDINPSLLTPVEPEE